MSSLSPRSFALYFVIDLGVVILWAFVYHLAFEDGHEDLGLMDLVEWCVWQVTIEQDEFGGFADFDAAGDVFGKALIGAIDCPALNDILHADDVLGRVLLWCQHQIFGFFVAFRDGAEFAGQAVFHLDERAWRRCDREVCTS